MDNAKRVLVIINPKSGKIRVKNQLFNIASFFSKCGGYETTVYTTNGRGEATKYARLLADKFDIIVCRGGDGTLNEVVNGLMQSGVRVPLGYIPSGTTNDFASSLGVPADAREAVKIITQSKALPHDIGIMNDEKYFGYTASFGLFTRSSYSTSQLAKNYFGYVSYLVNGIREVKDMRSIHMKITCDGKVMEDDYLFGSVSNALVCGGIIKYDRSFVGFSDGKFELTIAKKPKTFPELVDVVLKAARKNYDERYITIMQGSEITFESDEEVPWTIDGEFGGAHKVCNIKCLHQAIDIYKGENSK